MPRKQTHYHKSNKSSKEFVLLLYNICIKNATLFEAIERSFYYGKRKETKKWKAKGCSKWRTEVFTKVKH